MGQFPIAHRRLRANGIELHVAEAGAADGPLLVLLHGFPEFWFAWRDYMPALAELGFHVVAPDQRGYNLSDKPRGIGAYALDLLADDIAELTVSLGYDSFQVVGHDWGGSVAWSLASSHPSRLQRMVVLNAPHPAVWVRAMTDDPDQRRKSGYVRFLQIPFVPEATLRLGGYDGLAKSFATARGEAFTAETMQAYHRAWRMPGALTATLNYYRALLRKPMTMPAPGSLSPPCLILWGDDDPYGVRNLAEKSAALCAKAEIVHLPGVGHWIIHDARETVLAHLQRFLIQPQRG